MFDSTRRLGAGQRVARRIRPGVRALACAGAIALAACVAGDRLRADPSNPCLDFDALYASIRDGAIDREAARARVRTLLPEIRAYYTAHGGTDAPPDTWRFPVAGYGPESIGGASGSGYVPGGYDWFDGYKSRGHPGHDLFIHDRNQDELDDATGTPVNVLSMTSGVVVAYATEWAKGSPLRGGRYIYIYDPSQSGLFYYAHMREVLVTPGDTVRPGQVIATVGRSGRNASAPRSPTHLHVMFLAIEDGYPKPQDMYPILRRVARRPPAPRP